MFGYAIKKFVFNWVVILLILVIGASAAFGYNSLTGTFDLFAGFGVLGSMFGGLPSLGALILAIGALLVFGWGLLHLAKSDYTGRASKMWFHVFIGLVLVAIVGFVGFRWIKFGNDFGPTVGIIVGVIVLVTAAAAIITPRTKKLATTTP